MYSVSITTYDRGRRGRRNYFEDALKKYIDAGLLECKHISNVDIFVGHEKDEWCERVIPHDLPAHYLDKDATHVDNIMNVFNHVVQDKEIDYHLYLEDDLEPIVDNVFDKIWEWQMNTIPNPEGFGVFMDYKPIVITTANRRQGYRSAPFNTFTAIMMYKNLIRDFIRRGGYPKVKRPDEMKAPDNYFGCDHYFGKRVMQPTYIAVPSMFIHVGLQSVAHNRCFDKPLGV